MRTKENSVGIMFDIK
jgi:hypothetical protein